MSTYYYLACPAHKLRGPMIAGRSFPQRWWGPFEPNDAEPIAEFIRDHHQCADMRRVGIVVLSEYDLDGYTPEQGEAA